MTGLYVAVKYTERSTNEMLNSMSKFNIPNLLTADKIHTTIIYSKTYDNIKTAEYKVMKPVAVIGSMEIWKTQGGKSALVAKLDAPDLSIRHNWLMKNHNLTYDYDEYKPHITLSYDVPDDFDVPKTIPEISLIVDHEYQEDLIDDWSNT